jgi:hypothetical protein
MFEQEQQMLQSLRESLDKLNGLKAKDLSRKEELGTAFNFEEGIPIFERTLKLFRDLSECNFDNFPNEILNELKQSTDTTLAAFNQIRSFSVVGPANPQLARKELINSISNQYANHFRKLFPIIAFSIRKGTDFEKLEREGRETLELQHRIANDLKVKSVEILNKMQTNLDKVQQAARKIGVAQHSVHFMNQSQDHRKSSRIWLGATIAIGFVTILFAWFSLHNVNAGDSVYQIVRFTISRILIISILSYMLVWSGKNFLAHKHNEVVNKHRQNALSTFETFVAASDDQQTKNAVLLHATDCIFTPQISGYLGKDSEPVSANRFIEILSC